MDESTSDLASRPFADFPEEEELIIQFWRSCNAFLKSYELSIQEKRKPYVFYDGPPFATVNPFPPVYLNNQLTLPRVYLITVIFSLLPSRYCNFPSFRVLTIKDTVTRFAHVNGYA